MDILLHARSSNHHTLRHTLLRHSAYNWLVLADIRVYLSGALSRLIVRLPTLSFNLRLTFRICFVSGPRRATARVTSLSWLCYLIARRHLHPS
jgi:hypothetical protein